MYSFDWCQKTNFSGNYEGEGTQTLWFCLQGCDSLCRLQKECCCLSRWWYMWRRREVHIGNAWGVWKIAWLDLGRGSYDTTNFCPTAIFQLSKNLLPLPSTLCCWEACEGSLSLYVSSMNRFLSLTSVELDLTHLCFVLNQSTFILG